MANDLIDLIKTRRSVRSYTAEPVPEELLDQVLEAGTFAPTGGGRGTFVEDGSCVLENLMLAAHALRLASCWIHREREVFDSAEGKALLREWGLPETLRGVGAIALGYAAGPEGAAAPRKDGYVVRI